jgi:hypothetical protein
MADCGGQVGKRRRSVGDWTVGIYGRNITDERYDNARLNTDDYVLVMLSNDARHRPHLLRCQIELLIEPLRQRSY